MNYQETLDFLFGALPMYQRVGKSAFKKDLTNTLRLCTALRDPHHQFKSVHVAGTNGKGSSSHMIASVLQEAGYKVGLYTSPHLKSFTERIRINGEAISEKSVVDFVAKNKGSIESIQPSFFEMTVCMAFDQFAKEQVDIAIIEVGLGGRLDSTNIITPEICLITNIGLDHTDMLGDTLGAIAVEKAGIIKADIPVVIGETHSETEAVFRKIATERKAPITFADREATPHDYTLDLKGNYQQTNLLGVLQVLRQMSQSGWLISDDAMEKGLSKVIKNTGLKGRWQQLPNDILTICDTGHNVDGIQYIVDQINEVDYKELYLVLGFVNDKNLESVLALLPKQARYIFCQANVPRAMQLGDLKEKVAEMGLTSAFIPDVNEALAHARAKANKEDFIFVGGSTFVVAELNDL